MLKTINYNNKFFWLIAFLTGFAIPVSTFLQSLSLILVCLIALINPDNRSLIRRTFKIPFVSFSVLLYVLFLVWSLKSAAPLPEILHMLNKMLVYGLCPLIFVYYANPRYRQASIWGFVVGALLSLLVSFLMFIIDKPILSASHGGWSCRIGDWAAFHYHTDHNYFLACLLVGLISVFLYFANELSRRTKIIIISVVLLSLLDVFYLVQGRAGQIMCLEMLFLVFLLWSWKKGIIASIIIACMVPIIIYTSQAVKCGIDRTTSDVAQYNIGNPDTSVGDRLEFHKYAKELIYKDPILGYGTGSFKTVYHNLTGFTGDRDPYHPHNDFYWLWVELGILGPIVLLTIALTLLRYGFKYKTVESKLLIILSLSYLVGAQEGGFYTDAITSGAFVVLACILLSGSTIESMLKKR